MRKFENEAIESLLNRALITKNQYQEITDHQNRNLFSLNAELKLFLYVSVLLFTSGIGILIYNNIDTIGHVAILAILLVSIVASFYYCFKNAKGFQKSETSTENPLVEYLALAANILTCIFIGYLQFQYQLFGTHYGLPTLIPTAISLGCAYYFDNKSILSIGITGLAAYVGISVTPQDLLQGNNDFYANESLSYAAILLGFLLILWTIYSSRIQLKNHFSFIFLSFAIHIIGIACLANLVSDSSDAVLVFAVFLIASTVYFYKASQQYKSISLFIFMLLYAYIGFNILLFRLCEQIDFSDIWELFILVLPAYFIGTIVLAITLIKNFNKKVRAW